jgi:hypothetical protein
VAHCLTAPENAGFMLSRPNLSPDSTYLMLRPFPQLEVPCGDNPICQARTVLRLTMRRLPIGLGSQSRGVRVQTRRSNGEVPSRAPFPDGVGPIAVQVEGQEFRVEPAHENLDATGS